jgi:pimeloyl-ACP methyl ester carboxylesterase
MIEASAGAQRTATALAAITRADLSPVLRDTKVPLGVIWGVGDRTVPARNVARVRAARPDARVVMIERAGHVPMVERPEAFAAALESLLAALDKQSTTSASRPSTLP